MLKLDCKSCGGRCCTFNEKNFNVILIPKEKRKFKKFSKTIKTRYDKLDILKGDKKGNCIFFDEKKKRCKIYRNRPFECRMFPVLMDLKKEFVLARICPQSNNIPDKSIKSSLEEWKKQKLSSEWIKSYSTIHY